MAVLEPHLAAMIVIGGGSMAIMFYFAALIVVKWPLEGYSLSLAIWCVTLGFLNIVFLFFRNIEVAPSYIRVQSCPSRMLLYP